MTPLVTLDEVKLFCRLDGNHEDALLETFIGAATEAVRDVADGWEDDETDPVPDRIKLAVLTHVARCYDNRDETDLPVAVTRLLGPMRRLDI